MNVKKGTSIGEYSDALGLIFNNTLSYDVVTRIESGGYVLCFEIKNGKTEIIVYEL